MGKTDIFEGEVRDPCEPQKKVDKWDVYAEHKFCPKIKVTNWWYHREGYPKDNDDVVRAAYKRWGTWEEDKSHWTTETMQAMEEGRGDPELNVLKNQVKPLRILSFLNYPITLYGNGSGRLSGLKRTAFVRGRVKTADDGEGSGPIDIGRSELPAAFAAEHKQPPGQPPLPRKTPLPIRRAVIYF